MNARAQLTGAKGTREVTLEEFFTLPAVDVHRENSIGADEVITEIRIPAPAPNARSAYLKLQEKESFDWPVAEVAAVIGTDGAGACKSASIVMGAAAPVPHRAAEAEKSLVGKKIDEASASAAAKAALATATPLAQNSYKIPLFETMLRRVILAAAGIGAGARANGGAR
jgi:xanthine dehydrogenase YagS FAD-binding subunit